MVFAAADNFTLLRNFGFGGYGNREARLTAGIERVGQMPGHFPGRYQNDVKADEALGVGRMPRKPELGGAKDASSAAFGHRHGGIVGVITRFYFDEDERVPSPGHNIDFAKRCFEAARGDPVAFGHEQHGGAAFRGQAKPESGDALTLRFGSSRVRLCWPAHGAGSPFTSASAR
jgi:hypothetical protein